MTVAPRQIAYSAEEYVRREAYSNVKHELARGQMTVWRRSETGDAWAASRAGPGETIDLASVGCRPAVDDIYADPLASA